MGAAAAIALVFAGCCINVVFLELLITAEPGSGNIITFAQFLFISLEGLVFTSRLGTRPSVIPLRDYLVLVVMFFIVNITNNLAFRFRISMPLHIIFRSVCQSKSCGDKIEAGPKGGLIANLIMGWLVLGRHYSIDKCVSVTMITAGTLLATLASSDVTKDSDGGNEDVGMPVFLMGISLLTFALFLSARMGIFQECLYRKHGKHAREALFYIHILSMPGFLLTHASIAEHVDKFNNSPPLQSMAPLPVLAKVPKLWMFLVANMLTQYVCISSVFSLTTHCSSLTVTLVLTLRKFLSLIFSIIYFRNPFTLCHWLSTVLVFTGTLLFSDVPRKLLEGAERRVENMEAGREKSRREERRETEKKEENAREQDREDLTERGKDTDLKMDHEDAMNMRVRNIRREKMWDNRKEEKKREGWRDEEKWEIEREVEEMEGNREGGRNEEIKEKET